MKDRHITFNILPLIALLISSLPLLMLGYPQGHDWLFELIRVAEYKNALFVDKQFPPYWGSNLYGGYGSPIFIFYAPLYAFVSSCCSWVMGSITSGSMGALIIFSIIAVISMQLLLKAALGNNTFVNDAASRIAGYFFILNPYLLCNKLLRNANAEYAALCISPLALYGLLIIDRRPKMGTSILAIGLALTILAHNLTALVMMAFILVAAVVLYVSSKRILMALGGVVLALGLSAFFWVPAMYYQPFVRIDRMIQGKFDFHNQFQPMASFFGYTEFYSIGLLVPLVLICAVGMFWIACKRRELMSLKFCLLLFLASLFFLFLQTKASIFFWEQIPYLSLFQFPWRMMGPIAIACVIIIGCSFAYLCREQSRKIVLSAEIVILVICVINAVPHLKDTEALPESVSRVLSEVLRGDTIKNEALPATVLDEYLPRLAYPDIWLINRQRKFGSVVNAGPAGCELRVILDSGTSIMVEARTEYPTRLQILRWFFPGWTCTNNGMPQDIHASRTGTIDISIPAGSNSTDLTLKPPSLRRNCLWMSLVLFLCWIAALAFPPGKRYLMSGKPR